MDQGYYRHPTISGDRVVFVCEDDLWSVDARGGAATRLTVSFGTCTTPRFSPDGARIAFVSTDEGNPEVYVIPAVGGRPERLTFLGATIASISGWSADGTEIFFTANPRAWFGGETQAFAISPHGGTPRNLHLGHARCIVRRADGAVVLGRNAEDPARWKRYRGGTSGEIWIDATGGGEFERLRLPDGNPVGPMFVGSRLYFLADHEGIGNIYSCELDGRDVQRHTHENDYYARFPSTDGARIVYSVGGAIAVYDVASETTGALDIATHSAAPQTARRFEQGAEGLEHVAVNPDGASCALIVRGQPFSLPFFEGATIHYGIGSRARYRLAEWLHDGKRFACVTDLNGYEQLAVFVDGGGEPTFVTSGDIGRVTDLAASPTNDVLAFANHRSELCVVDIDDGRVRVLDASPAHRIEDLAFSPDGRFIAYVWSPMNGASIIRVAKIKSGKVHDVTSLLRVDRSPAWDPQGKYLYFLSARDFNPVYDALQFDLSFPLAERPFAVTLRGDVPSPFIPKPRPLHRDHDHHHGSDEKKHDGKNDKPVRIEIDFDGIQGRVLGFPVDEANYGQLVAAKERVLFTRFEVKGIKPAGRTWDDEEESGVLLAYDFDQQRTGTMASDVSSIRLGNDARTLLYTSQDRLRAIDVDSDLPEDGDEPKPSTDPGRKTGYIDLTRVNVEIEPRAEWAQMYREAWRLQTEQFWVEDMSDIDWDRVFDRYDAVLPRVRTRTELSDVIWEMQGELGTSHAYEYGGDHRIPPQYQRGFLGAELIWDPAANGYTIQRIYRGDSWNRETDSPLAEPGLDIRTGDVIVAIGGRHLSQSLTPDRLLVNTAGRDVAVTVERKGEARTLLVRALASESPLRYRAWVEENRRIVHERTGGAVGYLHVPDMGPWGFSEFHRGYLNEFDRRGLIVDVRFNRGGHVSPLLLEKLARKRVGYDVPRYGRPIPYPPESVAGPIVAMTNQFAGSDGDIFSHCFKLYKLGPLVGKRTWGGVIGIDPYHRLVDGTITTQPEFSFWFSDVGWKVENYGTDPDYDVDVAPHHYRDGEDPQLDLALRLIEGALANATPLGPELATRPSLPLPSLQ
jgi:tricorn protease